MKARDLISALEAQALPDADVWFQDENDAPLEVGGGYVDTYAGDEPRVVLTFLSHDKAGGF